MNSLLYIAATLVSAAVVMLFVFICYSAYKLAMYLLDKARGHSIKSIETISDTFTRYTCTCGVRYLATKHMEDHIALEKKKKSYV